MISDDEIPFPMNMNCPEIMKHKALIVDDETDTCFLLGAILNKRNIPSVFAGSIAEAGKLVENAHDFSIIFLDNHLPDGFGISVARQLKQKNPCAQLVMISAYDAGSDRKKAVDNGVDFFIGKPFSSETVFKALERIKPKQE